MSTYNPRIVAEALEDLESEITRWSCVARDMLTTATNTQQHAKEAVDRALHQAIVVMDRTKDDEELVENVLASVALTIEKCATATETAQNTLNESQAALTGSNTTLQKWQRGLERAMTWLTRAEAKLEEAIHELDSARSALRNAISDLSNAESRLRACQNNEILRGCKNEVAAVSKSRAEVTHAQQRVRADEQEVNATKKEAERAKTRVACCKSAVGFSTEAVNLSKESVHSAAQAVNFAERSFEFAHAAKGLASIVQEKMLAEVESAENMMAETKKAQVLTDEAEIHLQTADHAETIAQTYVRSVRAELGYRVQQLLDLNRSTILPAGDEALPKNGSPSQIKVYTRLDRETQILNGDKRDGTGEIIGPHGHMVMDQRGEMDDALTREGSIKKDTGQ